MATEEKHEQKRMKRKKYEKELLRLQGKLCALQEWVQAKKLRVIIVFEGRDAAGKGGTIKAITERVSPRVFRLVALPAPSDREKSQMYAQRYVQHFPAGGEIVIFDRSWYNRASVEHVMGFCSDEQYKQFLRVTPPFEKQLADSGIILIKLWLEVGNKEQERRFRARMDDPLRQWKLSAMDLPVPRQVVRILAGAGRHVQGDRRAVRAVVCRQVRRQAARAPECHRARTEEGPAQENQTPEGGSAAPLDEARVQR